MAAPAASGHGDGAAGRSARWTLSLPGFTAAPIEFHRDFWNTRRTLRALWLFVVTAVLVSITGARRKRVAQGAQSARARRFAWRVRVEAAPAEWRAASGALRQQ
jgi:hypothetical protein